MNISKLKTHAIIFTNIFVALVLGLFIPGIPVLAEITALPYNSNKSDLNRTDWFILSGKQGQTLEDALLLSNSLKDDREATVYAKDAQNNPETAFAIIPDQEENQNVGNWFKLETNKIIVPGSKNIKLPFKIQIPQDVKDGEYVAGFGVTELNQQKDQGLKIAIRKGVRAYIAVGKDFKLGAKVEKLNILDPKDENYSKLKETKQYLGKENSVLEFEAQNTGNIYGVLSCKYALNYLDGTVFENTFNAELAPRGESKKLYILTNQPYKIGKTEAILDCVIKPQNLEEKQVKFENQNIAIGDELNLSQSELDSFESSKQVAFVAQNQVKTQNDNPQNLEENKNINSKHFYWIIGAISILSLVLVISGVLYFKNKKNK